MYTDDEEFIGDDGDEVIVGDEDDDNPFLISQQSPVDEFSNKILDINEFLIPYAKNLNDIIPSCECKVSDSTLTFVILSRFLPPSLQMVCGFYLSPILVEVSLTFKEKSWKAPLCTFSASHPIFHQNYVGRPLVYDLIRTFFTNSFVPKTSYAFSDMIISNFTKVNLSFDDFVLVYLLSEIVECFYNIQNHCCICRQPLPFSVIKPSICSNKLCEVAFNEIGVGTSVAQEIRRDTYAADLLFSIFACSFNNQKYMEPCPPQHILRNARNIFHSLPPMETIAQTCQNDADIYKQFGSDTLDLLRWVILSNKNQLIHLPPELNIGSVGFDVQFMTLMASPDAEEAFQKKKNGCKSKKSVFLWHGSGGDRWHSIIRNGLMNMSDKDCIHGRAFGSGIYLAEDINISFGYSSPTPNLYRNSVLGTSLSLIALCEVAPVSQLVQHGRSIFTLTDEEAIIVRFIYPVTNQYSSRKRGITSLNHIPKIEDVMKYLEKKSKDARPAQRKKFFFF